MKIHAKKLGKTPFLRWNFFFHIGYGEGAKRLIKFVTFPTYLIWEERGSIEHVLEHYRVSSFHIKTPDLTTLMSVNVDST